MDSVKSHVAKTEHIAVNLDGYADAIKGQFAFQLFGHPADSIQHSLRQGATVIREQAKLLDEQEQRIKDLLKAEAQRRLDR